MNVAYAIDHLQRGLKNREKVSLSFLRRSTCLCRTVVEIVADPLAQPLQAIIPDSSEQVHRS
jgi:hypothetical protein